MAAPFTVQFWKKFATTMSTSVLGSVGSWNVALRGRVEKAAVAGIMDNFLSEGVGLWDDERR